MPRVRPSNPRILMSNVSLKIYGQTVTVEVPSDMPLLWALRDKLDLVGTKLRICKAKLRNSVPGTHPRIFHEESGG